MAPKIKLISDAENQNRLSVFIEDNEYTDGVYCSDLNGIHIHAYNIDFTYALHDFTVNDFPKEVCNLSLTVGSSFENCNRAQVEIDLDTQGSSYLCARFQQEVRSDHWKGNYSFEDFVKTFETSCLTNERISYYQGDEIASNGFGIEIEIDRSMAIKEIIKNLTEIFDDIIEHTKNNLSQETGLTFQFDFPKNLSAACEQYLIYFSQFMLDIGMEIESNLIQKNQKTIFSVTPVNKKHALSTIHEAISIYLSLPNSKIPMPEAGADAAVTQLTANVLHLQSQLTFLSATLEAKNATILALQTAAEIRQIAEISTIVHSDKNLVDIIKLKKYEGRFFSVDLPALIKILKRSK
ncbi:hypothetical protein CH92_14610 [Stutzerimonas stutzeri]|uniref:Uncharacterized protein n=1 Tax=Stutzerimonas stutzeri TaxID=316 RepID=W8R4U1_STUST|nr:hypothetical protein [Stutzerimonas stutzeri]AHL77664.1 hypothetical protein CH92_14610 [Stutzerimonas stutzeri]MCQ4329485.1 hypothetical protein [Stutzerimonas stutzeri]